MNALITSDPNISTVESQILERGMYQHREINLLSVERKMKRARTSIIMVMVVTSTSVRGNGRLETQTRNPFCVCARLEG